jgi:hypothetical protein
MKTLQKLDEIPEHVPLIVNLCLAGFVGLAHGGALALALTTEPDHLGEILPLARISLPLAAFVLLTSLLGFIWKKSRMPILASHAVVLCVGAGAMLFWATSILMSGIPEGNFSWSPGMMTFLCAYPVYLLRRTLLRKQLIRSTVVKYVHVFVLVVALVVDVGVFVKLISSFGARKERFRQGMMESQKDKVQQSPAGDVQRAAPEE